MRVTHVKLVYFKDTGKYYSEGEIDLPHDWLFHNAVEHICQMLDRGERPGLIDGHDFNALITVYTEFGPLPHLYIRNK